MAQRAYTIREIDELRTACENKYLYGSANPAFGSSGRTSRAYFAQDKAVEVEQLVRTYMLAGITAKDLIDAEASPVS